MDDWPAGRTGDGVGQPPTRSAAERQMIAALERSNQKLQQENNAMLILVALTAARRGRHEG